MVVDKICRYSRCPKTGRPKFRFIQNQDARKSGFQNKNKPRPIIYVKWARLVENVRNTDGFKTGWMPVVRKRDKSGFQTSTVKVKYVVPFLV